MRVAVLMGGVSSEREISLRSGKAIAGALASLSYDVQSVDIQSEDLTKSLDAGSVDAVFIALHGRFGEDGKVQRQCEAMGLAYTGSRPKASELALDKNLAKEIFVEADIRTPPSAIVRSSSFGELRQLEALGFPLVVKPPLEGSSIGLTIVHEKEKLASAVDLALRYGDCVLVESFIAGKELTVGILGDRALPVVQIIPNTGIYDYHSKYTPGQTEYLIPAPLQAVVAAKVQRMALEAFKALECEDFGRVDVILAENGDAFVLEVNTIPGFTETSLLPKAARAAGIEFGALCEKILSMGMRKMLGVRG